MATNPAYGGFRGAATSYAANLAAPVTKSAEAFRAMLAGYLSPEQISGNVAGLYGGAREQADLFGERLAAAGTQQAGALTNLAYSLPGVDPNYAASVLRSTARGGATGQFMGAALGQQARLAQALATQQALGRRETEMRDLNLQAIGKEEEAGRIAADILTPASQMGALATEQLNRRALREQMRNLPLERRALVLQNAAAEGQITAQTLQNAMFVKELKNQGFKVTTKNGKTVITTNNDEPVVEVPESAQY